MFGKKKISITVEVSARHCHLSRQDLDKLFGEGYELKKTKQLSQPSDFACEETVNVKTNAHVLENMRIVGPVREQTQVEISRTDAFSLGANPPIRLSGDLRGSAGVILQGPAGNVELSEGLIIVKRHIHCATEKAKTYKLKTGDIVSVEVKGERSVIFENVVVRVKDNYDFSMHIDTDEGNAAGINQKAEGFLVK